MTDIQQKCFNKALRLLSQRAHGTYELRRKLARIEEARGADIDAAIGECVRLNLLDDTTYAIDYARSLAERGNGAYKIKIALRRRGIGAEDTAAALAETSGADDELERAVSAAEGKLRYMKPGTPPIQIKAKLYRFLASRGFPASTVREATERLMHQD